MSSLRRVSSRQRLVSWDAFDATVYYDSTEEDEHVKAHVSNPDSSTGSHCLNSMMMPRHSSTTTGSVIVQPYNSEIEYCSTGSVNVDRVNNDFDDYTHKNEEEEEEDDSFDFKRKRRWYPTTRMTVAPSSNGYCFTANATTTSFPPPNSSHENLHVMPPTSVILKSHPNDGLRTTELMSTTPPTANTSAAALMQLPMEVQCMIYQYLTLLELRHVTQICTTLRQSLILSSPVEHPPVATSSSDHSYVDDDDVKSSNDTEEEQEGMNFIVESALWKPLCIHQYWPFLQPHQQLPFITSITQTRHDRRRKNYPVLLSMAISRVPTHVDTTLFPYSRHLRRNPSGNLQLFVEEPPEPLTPTSPNIPVVRPMSRFLHPKLISINCTITTTTTTTSNTNMTTIMDATQCERGQQQQIHQVIQFIGKVGFGDQCIRSNAPLPRPIHIQGHTAKWNFQNRLYDPTTSTSTLFQRVFRNTIHSSNGTAPTAMIMRRSSTDTTPITASLFCPLRRSVRIAARRGSSVSSNITNTGTTTSSSSVVLKRIPYRPFCVPFITHTNEINIAPRYIAYYEVTILPLPQRSDNSNTNNCTATITNTRYTKEKKTTVSKVIQYPQNHPNTTQATTTNNRHVTAAAVAEATPFGNNSSVSDCVAVGIGTENFPLQHRMPGWDLNSYGYHGDDGGIFHGNGSMIQQYNRTFGVNDTIGCGIDYIQNSIFFTLNGVFLGYAFPLLPKHRDIDLYPIIGMDTQYPILCNFHGPFVFDLPSMIQQHDTILREQLNL